MADQRTALVDWWNEYHPDAKIAAVAAPAPAPAKPAKTAAVAKPKPPVKVGPSKVLRRWPKPTTRVTFRGVTVNAMTQAALEKAEKILGYELTLLQGSYHPGVGASAGTHDRGGVVDLAPYDAERKVRVLRSLGFAAWHRLPWEGPWEEHIHAVLIGDPDLAPLAAAQVVDYKRGRNGLASNAPDTFNWRPSPIKPFIYPPKGA